MNFDQAESLKLDAQFAEPGSDAAQEGPIPLRREPPPPEPYPVDALGGLLGDITKIIQHIVKAPDALCAQSALGAAAWAAQSHANVLIDGRCRPISLYFGTVGESGERKSAVDDIVLLPHSEHERRLDDLYTQEISRWENHKMAWEYTRQQSMKKARTHQQRQDELFALGELEPKPLKPILRVSDPTLEGIYRLLTEGQPSIGLFTAEGGKFIGGHAMNPDNVLKTAAGLSSLWDGGCADRVRSGDGSSKLYGRRLSVHLMMQGVVAEMLTGNRILSGQGLLSRFLLAWPASTVGYRPYVCENPFDTPQYQAYAGCINALLTAPPPLREGTQNELTPRQLTLSTKAKGEWIRFHNAVDRAAGPGGRFEAIRAPANKAAEQAARIAGVLTLVADLDAGQVELAELEAAVTLAEYYLDAWMRIQEAGEVNPGLLLAEKVLQWSKKFKYVYPVLLYQRGPNGVRTGADAKRIAKILEGHGHWVRVEGGMVLDGKMRRDAWKVDQ